MYPIVIKAIVSILTALTLLAALFFVILGFVIHQPILVVVAIVLTGFFGYACYTDVKYWTAYFSQKK